MKDFISQQREIAEIKSKSYNLGDQAQKAVIFIAKTHPLLAQDIFLNSTEASPVTAEVSRSFKQREITGYPSSSYFGKK